MRAQLDQDGVWVVQDGRRWWTVSFGNNGAAAIYNEKLMPVGQHGALGKRLLNAVAVAQGKQRRSGAAVAKARYAAT